MTSAFRRGRCSPDQAGHPVESNVDVAAFRFRPAALLGRPDRIHPSARSHAWDRRLRFAFQSLPPAMAELVMHISSRCSGRAHDHVAREVEGELHRRGPSGGPRRRHSRDACVMGESGAGAIRSGGSGVFRAVRRGRPACGCRTVSRNPGCDPPMRHAERERRAVLGRAAVHAVRQRIAASPQARPHGAGARLRSNAHPPVDGLPSVRF